MKLTLAAVLALATLVVYAEANGMELLKSYGDASKTCKTKTGVKTDDIKVLKKFQIPESHAAQCYAICVAKKMEVVSADNKVNSAKLKDLAKKFGGKEGKFNEAMLAVLRCSNKRIGDNEKDECMFAKKMMMCVKESGVNLSALG